MKGIIPTPWCDGSRKRATKQQTLEYGAKHYTHCVTCGQVIALHANGRYLDEQHYLTTEHTTEESLRNISEYRRESTPESPALF